MITYIAFLRGVNVGGHTIKKEEFIEVFSSLGLENVRTFIASGNVLFESSETNEKLLEKKIEEALEKRFGYEVRTMLRTKEELQKMIEEKPFGSTVEDENKKLYVVIQSDKVPVPLSLPLASEKEGYEVIRADKKETYVITYRLANGRFGDLISLGKLFGKDIAIIMRNWNTMVRITKLFEK